MKRHCQFSKCIHWLVTSEANQTHGNCREDFIHVWFLLQDRHQRPPSQCLDR
jgi:hypothetical protein